MPKNVVIFSDGTGQDGGVRPEQTVSNVYKMYRACRTSPENPIDPHEQVAFYDPGLGTDIGATALSAPGRFIQKLLASVTGRGIVSNIADCYAFIINHYEPGDRIFLIGFSRGAYTVRCVANLLMLCGVPTATPSGPVMRFRKSVHDIAMEAVTVVLEHGAGHPREKFRAEREEQARRFRAKYHSDGAFNSNIAPYFIGVFDTVASLGAKGLRRLLIQLGLGIAFAVTVAILAVVPAAIIAAVLHWVMPFWRAFWTLLLASVAMAGAVWAHKQKESYRKTIRNFPHPGDVHTHYAEWKDENFDRLLSSYVPYARSANAIDENRKDFQRVGWGGAEPAAVTRAGPERLIQLWFPGNHSDIGGSYAEVESRLSDNALCWMIEQATTVPDGLKIGPVFVNGTKMPGTGNNGTPLNLYPRADGVQHCELAGMLDTIAAYGERLPKCLRGLLAGLSWSEEMRKIDSNAPVHHSVKERFKLGSVVQCARYGPYRPEALRHHDDFKQYYPAA